MRIAVVALDKIGLPLTVQCADKGHEVVGVNVNPVIIEAVNAGTEPFPGEARLAERLATLSPTTSNDALYATTDYAEAILEADAIMLVMLLFVNDATWEPDFAWIDNATRSLAAHLTPNALISYETTLPVGTLWGRFKPMIEEISGLKKGTDFHLVFSLERVLIGHVLTDLRRYPKLVGGLDETGIQAGIAFYESVLDFDEHNDLPRPSGMWDMGIAEAARMVRLAETTYRDADTGPANQFTVYADKAGFDIRRIIETCNSQPYSHIRRPGITVDGHYIPVYPHPRLSTGPNASVVRTARTFSATMPAYIVGWATEVLGSLKGLHAVALGTSYRGKVKETAFSGVFPTVEALHEAGAEVLVHNPIYTDGELTGFDWTPYYLGEQVDVAIIQADHPEYGEPFVADLPRLRLLPDERRATDATK